MGKNPFEAFMKVSTSPKRSDTVLERVIDKVPIPPVTDEAAMPTNPLSQLLGGAEVPVTEAQMVFADTDKIQADSVYELAAINTESLEPVKVPENAIARATHMRERMMKLKTHESVRALCDDMDAHIVANPLLKGPILSVLRAHVAALMVTLKQNPEFDSVMIDKDVHNIMTFVQATREEATMLRDVKTDKKTKRVVTKEVKKITESAFSNAFAAVMNAQMGRKP